MALVLWLVLLLCMSASLFVDTLLTITEKELTGMAKRQGCDKHSGRYKRTHLGGVDVESR